MKKLIIGIFTLCGLSACAQVYTPTTPTVYGTNQNRNKTFYSLHLPQKIGLQLNTLDSTSQIFYNMLDSSVWYYSKDKGYTKLGSGGGGIAPSMFSIDTLKIPLAGTNVGKEITGRLLFSNITGNLTSLVNVGGQMYVGSGSSSSNLSITTVKGYTQYSGTGYAKLAAQNGASLASVEVSADGTDGTVIVSSAGKGMKGFADYNILNPNDSLLYAQQGYIKKFVRDSIAAIRAIIPVGLYTDAQARAAVSSSYASSQIPYGNGLNYSSSSNFKWNGTQVEIDGTGLQGLLLKSGGATPWLNYLPGGNYRFYNYTLGRDQFSLYLDGGVGIGGSAGSEAIKVSSADNVGIGTTTPLYKLDVVGDAQITGGLVVNDLGGNGIQLSSLSGGQVEYLTDGGPMVFNNLGNLGINTNIPSEKLHVVGNARITALASGGTQPTLSGTQKTVVVDANGKLGFSNEPIVESYNILTNDDTEAEIQNYFLSNGEGVNITIRYTVVDQLGNYLQSGKIGRTILKNTIGTIIEGSTITIETQSAVGTLTGGALAIRIGNDGFGGAAAYIKGTNTLSYRWKVSVTGTKVII